MCMFLCFPIFVKNNILTIFSQNYTVHTLSSHNAQCHGQDKFRETYLLFNECNLLYFLFAALLNNLKWMYITPFFHFFQSIIYGRASPSRNIMSIPNQTTAPWYTKTVFIACTICSSTIVSPVILWHLMRMDGWFPNYYFLSSFSFGSVWKTKQMSFKGHHYCYGGNFTSTDARQVIPHGLKLNTGASYLIIAMTTYPSVLLWILNRTSYCTHGPSRQSL